MNGIRFWLTILIVPIALVGCVSHRAAQHGIPSRFDEQKVFAAGDRFELVVRGRRLDEFTIEQDGTITLPLVSGRIKVAGLSAREISKLVSESYRPHGPSEREVEVLPVIQRIK